MDTSAETVTVRAARREDGEAYIRLVDALAVYEKLDPPTAEAKARLVRDAFGDADTPARFTLLVAERGSELVGYAMLVETYSSFLARPTLYIEDVFVATHARRSHVGTALLKAIARTAVDRGCHRIEGVVLGWNTPAQEFYKRTGGSVREDWWLLRYDRAGIEALVKP